jgi:hypothetical protein
MPVSKTELKDFYTRKINVLKTYTQITSAKIPPEDFALVEKTVSKILLALKRTAKRRGVSFVG